MIYIEMTGSPKNAYFVTKEIFLDRLRPHGYEYAKMTARNNQVNILVTQDLTSDSKKMQLARRLGIDIMTYDELAEMHGFNQI